MWYQISPGWFRLFLAFVVVLYHTSKLVFCGYWAVFVFFMLSGYWIAEMYGSRYSKARAPCGTFYLSRLLRLYPVFVACTLLSLLAIGLGTTSVAIDKSIIVAGWFRTWVLLGYSGFAQRLLVPGWSLDIELQFYLLFPLIHTAMSANTAMRICACILLIVVSLLLSVILGLTNSVSPYLVFFLAGVAISHRKWEAPIGLKRRSLLSLVLILVMLALITESRTSVLTIGRVHLGGQDVTTIVDVVLALLTIPFVSGNVRVRDSRLGRHAGNLSFEIYLVHWVTLGTYVAHFGYLPMRERFPYFVVYLLVTVAISVAVYILVDIPCEKLRKRIVSKLSMSTA